VPAPVPKPEPPKEAPKPQQQQAEVKPPPKKPPPPQDDFQSLLKTIDKMKTPPQPPQQEPPKPAKPQPPKPDDFSQLQKTLAAMQPPPAPPDSSQKGTSTIRANEISLQPTASETDFVRGQIERHWNFDVGARDAANLIVNVHVQLLPDGTVASADIVVDSARASDGFYQSAAESARRAVLAASPLQLPPGSYEKFKDFTFRFDPRNAAR